MNDYTGLIETVWTITAVVGAIVSAAGVVDIWKDLQNVGHPGNGRRILGLALISTESIRFVIQASWTLVGIWLMSDPDNNIQPTGIILILIASNFLTMVKTLITTWARWKIREVPSKGRRSTDL